MLAQLSNLFDLLTCQLGIVIALAKRMASLCNHVGVIVATSARPDVVRIDTGAIVALVTRYFSFWKGLLVVDFPRYPTSNKRLSAKIDRSIARTVRRTLPRPTFIRIAWLTKRPKVFLQRVIPAALQTVHRAKAQIVTTAVFFCRSRMPIGQIRRLPTPALANAVGREQAILGNPRSVFFKIVGKIGRWGMISHVVSPFMTTGHVQGCFQHRLDYLIGCCLSILAHMCRPSAYNHLTRAGGPTP